MIKMRCDQLMNYHVPDDYAVLEIATVNGKQGLYLVSGAGELLYKCEESQITDDIQIELRSYLDSLSAIVIYDTSILKESSIAASVMNMYQLVVCEPGVELASIIGTWDMRKGKWLIRELEEVLSFYRCEHNPQDPIERAKAILWLVDQIAEMNTTELTIKREQKQKDFRKMRGYLMQAEGK